MHSEETPKRSTRTVKLAASAVALGLLGVVAGAGTWSAFSSVTANAGNSFAAGTVVLGDNDAGSAMFSLTGMKPGDTDTHCIEVEYTGSLPAAVRLYGTTGGSGLDQYLDLTITRGTIATPTFDSCSGFTADATDYTGAGAGVVFSGSLQGLPDTYAAGLVDPTAASPESWTGPSEKHVYKFVVTLQDNDGAQGKTATQTFTWEARNS